MQLLTTPQIIVDTTLSNSSDNAIANSTVMFALNGKSNVSAIVYNSNASVTLTLNDNSIYELTASAVTDLTFSGVSSGFQYAALTFTSGSTATLFGMPNSGWYCVGAACSSGTFTPVASMRYNLAIEQEADRIAVYVMEAL